MAQLYANENFPFPVVEELRINSNHSGLIVCSFDSDFVRLANQIHATIESKSQLSRELIRINRPSQ